MERMQVNLPRSLRQMDGDKKEAANNAPKILLQVQGLARSYGTEGGVEGLRERNREKAKERMRKKSEGWRKEMDVK